MNLLINPPRSRWKALCRRPSSEDPVILQRVEAILSRVRQDGDEALRQLSTEIDGQALPQIEVSEAERSKAEAAVSEEVKQAIESARKNIRAFHTAQLPTEICVETAPGVRCLQRPVPIRSVGLYIPGGTAPLFSTVLMLAVPAQLAGCKELILCTPPGKNGKVAPEVLYTARRCGVDRIFKIGGAQAIAAMAYGTATVPAVDKILGPGNPYVTTAKQLLGNKQVAIDLPAGPSEVMVLADESVPPAFVAADLLSQAEHGADSQVMLLCTSQETAEACLAEVRKQLAALPRARIARQSLAKSRCLVFHTTSDMVDFADTYGPEHLIVALREPWSVADRITNAGSVFVGPYSPESAGDYASGTNHTLPTAGWARAYNGVNIDSFLRKMTLQELSREGLTALAPTLITLAQAEGLQAHAQAVQIRTAYAAQ